MKSETTSPTLLYRLRDPTDRAAWREFDAKYGELILRYCHRFALQHSDAEDVRQVVMLKLSRTLREFQYEPKRGKFRVFLWCVVRNEVVRYLGRPDSPTRRVQTNEAVLPDAAAVGPMDELWEEEWSNHHLRAAMRHVRETCDPRSIEILERLLAGDRVVEVANRFRMTTDAVHKVKQRMRDRLKERIAEQIREEDQPHA